MVVDEKDLEAGNSIVMGGGQLVGFVGPIVAGIVIGNFSQSLFGVGLALAIDAATYAVSALMLWLMRSGGTVSSQSDVADRENVWASIIAGLKYVWHDNALRLMFLVIIAVIMQTIMTLLCSSISRPCS